jgi:CheY-like chemotaxis protein
VPLVLIVEDHSDTRMMYAEFLADRFEVIEAADGERALEAMQTRVPDVVITDVSLPHLDGLELTIRMRKNAALAKVPVICLSGYSSDALEQRAIEAGCTRLLEKPCLPDDLATVVTEVLTGRQPRRPAR